MQARRFSPKIIEGLLQIFPVFAVGSFLWCQVYGPFSILLFQFTLAGLPVRVGFDFNALSSILLSMVSLLSLVIGRYSSRYLDGEQRQEYFFRYMGVTVSAVSLLVLSDNLLMFVISWCLTSFGIHRLLLYYPDRLPAQAAAKKKLFVSRMGDLALIVALGATYQMFGTFEFESIFRVATDPTFGSAHAFQLNLVGCLFAVAAVTKSAQFPFHFWLPETMETPTPVSALMHAGVINAGGFLIIRLSPILTHAALPHTILTLIGALTAAYGGLVMITQNDIKKKLAYSTISQMGMMIFACGLGAYSIALLHIIAHSFYKAHAFLSTGDVVRESRKSSAVLTSVSAVHFLALAILGFGFVCLGTFYFGGAYLAYFTYAGVMTMALLANRAAFPSLSFSRVSYSSLVGSYLAIGVILYSIVELYFNAQLRELVADSRDVAGFGSLQFIVNLTAIAIIAGATYLAFKMMEARATWAQRLYVHFWNGAYFGSTTDRWLNRLWPSH